jgi:hypothetical protein
MPQKKAKAKFQYRTKRTFAEGAKKTKTFIYLTEEEHEILKKAPPMTAHRSADSSPMPR